MITAFYGLRFYFSLIVFLNHCNFLKASPKLDYVFEHLLHNGGFAVTFFFILSGFCMAIGYANKFKSLNKEGYITFICKRIKKIFPIYLLTMICALFLPFCAITLRNGFDFYILCKCIIKLILATTMAQSLTVSYWSIGNSAGWFISTVFILYCLTPLLLRFSDIVSRDKKHLIFAILFSWLMMGLIFSIFYYLCNCHGLDYCIYNTYLYTSPFIRIFEYLFGILIGSYYLKSETYTHTHTHDFLCTLS